MSECSLQGCGRQSAFKVTAGAQVLEWACSYHLAVITRRLLAVQTRKGPQVVVTAMVGP